MLSLLGLGGAAPAPAAANPGAQLSKFMQSLESIKIRVPRATALAALQGSQSDFNRAAEWILANVADCQKDPTSPEGGGATEEGAAPSAPPLPPRSTMATYLRDDGTAEQVRVVSQIGDLVTIFLPSEQREHQTSVNRLQLAAPTPPPQARAMVGMDYDEQEQQQQQQSRKRRPSDDGGGGYDTGGCNKQHRTAMDDTACSKSSKIAPAEERGRAGSGGSEDALSPTPNGIARATSILLESLELGQQATAAAAAAEGGDGAAEGGDEWINSIFRVMGLQSSEGVCRGLRSARAHLITINAQHKAAHAAVTAAKSDHAVATSSSSSNPEERMKQLAALAPLALRVLQQPLQMAPDTSSNGAQAQVMSHQQAFMDATQANNVQRRMDSLKDLCSAHVASIAWWQGPDATLARCVADSRVSTTAGVEAMQLAQAQWQSRQRATADHMQKLEAQKQQADAVITRVCSGQQADSVVAALDVLQSQDPAVTEALGHRKALTDAMAQHHASMQSVSDEGAYLNQCIPTLLTTTQEQFAADMQEYRRAFGEERARSVSSSEEALTSWMPQLFGAVESYTKFQMERKSKAQEKLEQRQAELEEHTRLFGDDSPSEGRELEAKVREMTAIVSTSSKCLERVVNVQATFWSRHLHELTPAVRTALVSALHNSPLFTDDTSGAMKELLSKCKVDGVEGGAFQPGGGGAEVSEYEQEQALLAQQFQQEQEQQQQQQSPASAGSASSPAAGNDGPPLAVGQVIRTLFKVGGKERWFQGDITAVYEDGLYDVQYSDGDCYERMSRKKLVVCDPGEADRINAAKAAEAAAREEAAAHSPEDFMADVGTNASDDGEGGSGCIVM